MKTITDEYMEQNREEVEYYAEEYAEYAANTKIVLIKSLKFYAVGFGVFLAVTALAALLDWGFLAAIAAFILTITVFGGLAIGFIYKGIKPVFKMMKYYLVTIMEKLRDIGAFFSIIPFAGLIINFGIMIIDLWLISFAIGLWTTVPPVVYFGAYKFFSKLSKGYKDGLEWHNRRKARNYADLEE